MATPAASASLSVELQVNPKPVAWPAIVAVGAASAGFLALVDTPPTDSAGEGEDERTLLLGSADATGWRRLDPSPFGGWPYQVAGSDRGWIMTTLKSDAEGISTLTIWHSQDGLRWAGTQIGKVSGTSLVAGPDGYHFLGSPTEGDEPQLLAWSSPDGVTWRSSTSPGQNALDVIATPRCLVALDEESLFVSPSGASWARFALPRADASFGAPMVELNGRLAMFRTEEPGRLAIYTSARFDASSDPCAFAGEWTQDRELEGLFEGYSVVAIPPAPGRSVVYGYNLQTLAPAAWTVAGSSWQRDDLTPGVFDSGMPAVFAFGPSTAVAVGVRADAAGSTSRLWRSTDGLAWQPVETEALQGPTAPTGPCPEKPTSVAKLIDAADPAYGTDIQELNFARLVRCFGSETLRVKGYRVSCECGGIGENLVTPAWRDWFNAGDVLSDKPFDAFGRRMFAYVDPAKVPRKPDYDVHIEIAGHFDDPGSSTCRVASLSEHFAELRPPSEATEICRRQFVVTGFSTIR